MPSTKPKSKKLRPVERATDEIPLWANDDRLRLNELELELNEASVTAGPKRMNDAPVVEAAAAYDAFKAEALGRSQVVHITALPGPKWRFLLADHPPRDDVKNDDGEVTDSWPQDQEHGFNIETIARPLVIASLDLDQFDDDDAREAWVDDLDDPTFSRIYSAAVRINERGGADPKWSASSWVAQTSAAILRSLEASGADSPSSHGSPKRIGDSSEPTG